MKMQLLFSMTGWIGYAVDYSGFREGQDPEGVMPTKEEIREDLHILAPNFTYIRLYSSNRLDTRLVLEVIREDQLDIKVVLGAWLQCEAPGHWAYQEKYHAINEEEIETAIALAKEFGDTVVAVTVGNEILVSWSFWPVPLERVISLVKRVQEATGLPVSVADDYSFWATPEGAQLAAATDFVFIHTHPIWHKKDIDEGFDDFIATFEQVRQSVGPGKRLIVGETGWATLTTPPEKEPLHAPGAGSEEKQAIFWHQLHDWAIAEGVPIFWFSAFDEPWKDATGTEGFWGLYDVERKPRKVLGRTTQEN
jgi:exo-beta-1,3-glucanase (GH17 family)